MNDIATLGREDCDRAVALYGSGFADDPAFHWVFRSKHSRARWLPAVSSADFRIGSKYGTAVGIRADDGHGLAAIATWYSADKPFPPPWYHSLIATRLYFFPLEPFTWIRFSQLYDHQIRMLPQRERFIYLSGLVVDEAYRGRGLGVRLIRWGQQLAVSADAMIFLHCWETLVAYYQRFGFTVREARNFRGVCISHGMVWEPPAGSEIA